MRDRDGAGTQATKSRWTLVAGLVGLSTAVGIALLPGVPAARAGDGCCGEEAPAAPAGKGLLADLGNGTCPIMGGKPDGRTWSEWRGLRIGHCCPMCAKTFAADPEKALQKAGIEWKAAAAAVAKVNGAKTAEERTAALKALAAKWKVVREPEAAKAGLLADLGNEKCPVMGGKPDGKTWSEWNGLRVGHCCGMCVRKFAADPEKALEKAGIEWKAAAAAVAKVNAAKTAEERGQAMKALAAKWKVVREPEPAATPGPAK